MKNKIIADHGSWLEIDVSTAKIHGAVMKINKDDYWEIFPAVFGKISASRKNKTGCCYAICHKSRKQYSVHRLILKDVDCVDHINGDGLDNRKSNLRDGSGGINQRNRKVDVRNTSGVTGVFWDKRHGVWVVRISTNRGRVYVGRYKKFDDAVQARWMAEDMCDGYRSSMNE